MTGFEWALAVGALLALVGSFEKALKAHRNGAKADKDKAYGAAAVILVVAIIMGSAILKDVHTRSASAATKAPEIYKISAPELLRRYEANEVKENLDLHGKTLVVTGNVSSIDMDISNSAIVRLHTGEPLSDVAAHLRDGQSYKAAALVKGQSVVVQCQSAALIIGSPQLRECDLL